MPHGAPAAPSDAITADAATVASADDAALAAAAAAEKAAAELAAREAASRARRDALIASYPRRPKRVWRHALSATDAGHQVSVSGHVSSAAVTDDAMAGGRFGNQSPVDDDAFDEEVHELDDKADDVGDSDEGKPSLGQRIITEGGEDTSFDNAQLDTPHQRPVSASSVAVAASAPLGGASGADEPANVRRIKLYISPTCERQFSHSDLVRCLCLPPISFSHRVDRAFFRVSWARSSDRRFLCRRRFIIYLISSHRHPHCNVPPPIRHYRQQRLQLSALPRRRHTFHIRASLLRRVRRTARSCPVLPRLPRH